MPHDGTSPEVHLMFRFPNRTLTVEFNNKNIIQRSEIILQWDSQTSNYIHNSPPQLRRPTRTFEKVEMRCIYSAAVPQQIENKKFGSNFFFRTLRGKCYAKVLQFECGAQLHRRMDKIWRWWRHFIEVGSLWVPPVSPDIIINAIIPCYVGRVRCFCF